MSKGSVTRHDACQMFDETFLQVLENISNSVIQTTSESVEAIVGASQTFLSSAAQKAIADFHELYFSSNLVGDQKNDVSAEVDDLFEEIQRRIAAGEEHTLTDLKEDEAKKQTRLGLAAIQKELETIITVDESLKEKLVPALMAMQFEDTLRQVLSRLPRLWHEALSMQDAGAQQTQIIETLSNILSTKLERNIYFPLVANTPVPKQLENDGTWFDTLLE